MTTSITTSLFSSFSSSSSTISSASRGSITSNESTVGFFSQYLTYAELPHVKENMVNEKSHDALVSACKDKSEGFEAGDHAICLLRDGASIFGTSQPKKYSNALANAQENITNKILKYLKEERYCPSEERATYHTLRTTLSSDVVKIIIEYDQFSGLNQIQRLMYGREGDIGTKEWDERPIAVKVAESGDIENFNAFLDLGFDWKRPMFGLMWKYTSNVYETFPTRFSCNWGYTTPLSISFYDYIYAKESIKPSPLAYNDTINFANIPNSIILRMQEVFISKNKRKRRLEEVEV